MPIESAQLRAGRLLVQLCADDTELKKLTAKNRTEERIDLLRQAVAVLLINGIPTAVIAKILKIGQGAVQYHARWLEKNGKIVKPKRFAHWIDAEQVVI
jgi:hypothetical protein